MKMKEEEEEEKQEEGYEEEEEKQEEGYEEEEKKQEEGYEQKMPSSENENASKPILRQKLINQLSGTEDLGLAGLNSLETDMQRFTKKCDKKELKNIKKAGWDKQPIHEIKKLKSIIAQQVKEGKQMVDFLDEKIGALASEEEITATATTTASAKEMKKTQVIFREAATSVQVHIRGVGRNLSVNGKTEDRNVKCLRLYVENVLNGQQQQQNSVPFEHGIVKIFVNRRDVPNPLSDEDYLRSGEKYTALEHFDVVPTNLYRKVPPGKLETCVRSKYGNPFSAVSPLFCAALSKTENIRPPYYLYPKANFWVGSGVSLGWEMGGIGKKRRKYPSANDTLDDNKYFIESLKPDDAIDRPLADTKEFKNSDGIGRAFSNWFRYELREGTNLSELGTAVVFDKPNHFTLICTNEPVTNVRKYKIKNKMYTPVRWSIPIGRSNHRQQPEALEDVTCCNRLYQIALPKIAKRFVFHDFFMEAKAQPKDDETADDDDSKSISAAAQVLFVNTQKIDCRIELGDVFEILKETKYNPDQVPLYAMAMLLEAIDDLKCQFEVEVDSCNNKIESSDRDSTDFYHTFDWETNSDDDDLQIDTRMYKRDYLTEKKNKRTEQIEILDKGQHVIGASVENRENNIVYDIDAAPSMMPTSLSHDTIAMTANTSVSTSNQYGGSGEDISPRTVDVHSDIQSYLG